MEREKVYKLKTLMTIFQVEITEMKFENVV